MNLGGSQVGHQEYGSEGGAGHPRATEVPVAGWVGVRAGLTVWG